MKLLVTGSKGQVALSLIERASGHSDIDVVTLGRPQLDLANPSIVAAAMERVRPDVVVSAAAYTAVDHAEDEPDLAYAVNAIGAGAVAKAASSMGVPIIHLSTDYVFSGDAAHAYRDNDAPSPVGVYGKTKLAGEIAVAAANPSHVILRTAWIYSPFGANFVRTMLRLAADRDEISVVSDQYGNPTSALDIADGIFHIARQIVLAPGAEHFGVFHLAGRGSTNWSGLAEAVMQASKTLGGPCATIRPITTAQYPTKAHRPANSCLSTAKLEARFGWRAPDWSVSLPPVVKRLVNDQAAAL